MSRIPVTALQPKPPRALRNELHAVEQLLPMAGGDRRASLLGARAALRWALTNEHARPSALFAVRP
jgi:hypothetical protein